MQFYGGLDDGKTNLSIMLSDTYLNGQYEPFVSKAAAMAYLILDQRFVHVHVPVCVMLSCACCFTGTKKNLKFVFHTLRCQLSFLKSCSSLPSEQDLWVALSKVCTFTRFVTISLLPYSYYRGSDKQLIFVTLLYTNLEPISLYVILIKDAACIILITCNSHRRYEL